MITRLWLACYKHFGGLQKSCVGNYARKPIERALYCLKIPQLQFKLYSNRGRSLLEPLAAFAYVVRTRKYIKPQTFIT